MEFVLTLIADPAKANLRAEQVAAAGRALASAGARCGEADWLAPRIACDLPFESLAPARAAVVVGERLVGCPLDLAAQPAAGRRKALLVADMESTIIHEEMLDHLAARLGIGEEVAAMTAEAMAGQRDFRSSLKARVALLRDAPVALLAEAADEMTLAPGACELVATMAANGAYTALVTGGFDCFAEPIRARCGFDVAHANRLLVADGRLTGAVSEPILGADAKRDILVELAAARGLGLEACLAIGDGANDRHMIAAAGLGVAYRAKPALKAAASAAVDHGDLTAALYLQGFRREDFRG